MTWLASNTGTVSQSLRYDPWGTPRATVPTGYSPFRFQGSYTDDLRDTDNSNDLAWVVTRWYAPALGRFVSEDSVLGEPIDPPSRHLYAYGQGDPVGTWDPDGRFWYRVKAGDTLAGIAQAVYGTTSLKGWIKAGNPGEGFTPIDLGRSSLKSKVGKCLWVPFSQKKNACGSRHDSVADGRRLWSYFDRTVTILARAMRKRARDGADGLGIMNAWLPGDFNVALRFAQLVIDKGPWDIKYDIQDWVGGNRNKPYYTPVRDDPVPESFRSDLWGLIQYGYLGRAHNIGPSLLRFGNLIGGGRQGPDDNFALELGMDMYRAFGANITETELRRAVLSQMPRFRRLSIPRYGDASIACMKPIIHRPGDVC